MYFSSAFRIRFDGPVRSFSGLILVLLLAATVHSQVGNTGMDDDRTSGMRSGTNTIIGQVIFPAGHPPNKRCTVRLSSVRVGEFSALTDDNGVFIFRRLREGSYFITVEAGTEYLPAQETADLYDNRSRTLTVQIELRLRPTNRAKPAVVNASLAGVPKDAAELYQRGLAASAAGDNKKAIESLKSAVALYPGFVLALNELSALYVNTGELDKAEQALAEAVRYEPNNAILHLNYGYVMLLRERFADSDRQLQRAIQLKDDLVTAHLYRGRVLIRLGKLDEAEKELNRALTLPGKSGVVAYRYLAALYSERGETARAIVALETYLKLLPNASDAAQVQKIIQQLREQEAPKKN
jgi:tetratricopeptide (TPR) repeat protein